MAILSAREIVSERAQDLDFGCSLEHGCGYFGHLDAHVLLKLDRELHGAHLDRHHEAGRRLNELADWFQHGREP